MLYIVNKIHSWNSLKRNIYLFENVLLGSRILNWFNSNEIANFKTMQYSSLSQMIECPKFATQNCIYLEAHVGDVPLSIC